ncbi:MAG: TRAP transporter substrate-binding protein, partial [Clostridia bacterium]|nr:TRAP transporter substrate-binding protein [Clostridia bacterium]
MKKLLALILAVLMIAGCVSAMAEDQFAALGNYTMTVGHAQPESNPRYISMEKFAADVAEKTNGHVTVEVFGNGQLGTEKEMLEQVVAGVTQGMRGGQYDFSPRLLMFTLPFLANNRAEVTALLQSDLAKKVSAEAAETTGTVIINLCDAGGFRQFSNNTRPLTKPEDLAGLKMRTNGMKTIDLTFQAMGANTVSVPYADLYMGLKTAIADGQENPWVNVEGMKFYEVQKYFTEVNYQFHP